MSVHHRQFALQVALATRANNLPITGQFPTGVDKTPPGSPGVPTSSGGGHS